MYRIKSVSINTLVLFSRFLSDYSSRLTRRKIISLIITPPQIWSSSRVQMLRNESQHSLLTLLLRLLCILDRDRLVGFGLILHSQAMI